MITFIDSDNIGANNVQNVTRSRTVAVGLKQILVVYVHSETEVGTNGADYNTDGVVTGITYDGVALTKLRSQQGDNGSSAARVEVWYLVNPNSGTHDIVVTRTGQVAGSKVGSHLFAGVNQSNPFNVQGGNEASTGTAPTVSINPAVGGSAIICAFSATTANDGGAGHPTPGGSATSTYDDVSEGFSKGASYLLNQPTGAQDASWTIGADSRYGVVAAALSPHVSGGNPMFMTGGGVAIG